MKLVIVESPAKVSKISKVLGKNYIVLPTGGHFRDLPENSFGFDMHNLKEGREPEISWKLLRGKYKFIRKIKDNLDRADMILVATDPDREGEAIGWHVIDYFRIKKPVKRVVFHEITKDAIKEAFSNLHDINMALIEAQRARRVLDRIVGYKISPVLYKLRKNSSAGRVQSAVLHLVVKRTREIEEFKPETFWLLKAYAEDFEATYVGSNPKGKPVRFKNVDEVKKLVDEFHGKRLNILSVKEREERKKPPPPFNTSSMLEEAFKRLGFSSSKTMKLAQSLYEKGLITYHRTDALHLSDEAIRMAREFLRKYYPDILPKKPNFFRTRVACAQEAHEAVRPTNLDAQVEGDEKKLFELVRLRFLASQSEYAVFKIVDIVLSPTPGHFFRASLKELISEGFLKIWSEEKEEQRGRVGKEGEKIEAEYKIKEEKTKPPPYFTEASLIREMEKLGIGRPSTYAYIIQILFKRGYLKRDGRKLIPTEDGKFVNSLLESNFKEIQSIELTAQMEEELDRISRGEMKWAEFLKIFTWWFEERFQIFVEKVKKKLDVSKQKRAEKKPKIVKHGKEDKRCPECSSPLVIRKNRKTGKEFLGCSSFPKCKYTESLRIKIMEGEHG